MHQIAKTYGQRPSELYRSGIWDLALDAEVMRVGGGLEATILKEASDFPESVKAGTCGRLTLMSLEEEIKREDAKRG